MTVKKQMAPLIPIMACGFSDDEYYSYTDFLINSF